MAVIAGAGKVGVNVAKYLHKNNWIGIQVNGFFDDRLEKGTSVQVTDDLETVVRACQRSIVESRKSEWLMKARK